MKEKLIKIIYESYPYQLSDVELIYQKVESFDITIEILEGALRLNIEPMSVFKLMKENETLRNQKKGK
jgi:hypothetical protein